MIASLPMYQRPELAGAHKRYWALIYQALAERGIAAPAELSTIVEYDAVWTDPSLVLSQTCGLPYRTRLHQHVTLIGTPDFSLSGCQPGYYRSAIVVRADDPRDDLARFIEARFAYNGIDSQSGYAAPYRRCQRYGFWFTECIATGSHAASARAVAAGRADVASLDAVSWRFMQRYDAFSQRLRVLDWTEPTPGLPYIAAAGADRAKTLAAAAAAISALTGADRQLLGLSGIVAISRAAYLAVPNPPPPTA